MKKALLIVFLLASSTCKAIPYYSSKVVYVKANDSQLSFVTAAPIKITQYKEKTDDNVKTFTLDPNQHAQQYLGVGSSFEEASDWNLYASKKTGKFEEIFKKLFSNGEQDFNWNLMRVTFGTSDYTPRATQDSNDPTLYHVDPNGQPYYYSYADNGVHTLNVGPDQLESKKIDCIKEAMRVKKYSHEESLLLFASAWSPPAYMKIDDGLNISTPIVHGLIGGLLNPILVDALAHYYYQTLLAYHKLGINFYSMSELNEPCVGRATTVNYPNACIPSEDIKSLLHFIKEKLTKYNQKLSRSPINTKIWVNDFNFAGMDAESLQKFDGVAYHSYYGSVTEINNAYKQLMNYQNNDSDYKGIYLTEFMTGFFGWEEDNTQKRILDAARLLEYFHQGSSSYINWVTLQDDRMGQPSGNRWYKHNAIYTHDGTEYTYDFMDYALGAIAKFVIPGGKPDGITLNAYVLADSPTNNQYYINDYYAPTDFSNAPFRTTDDGDNLPTIHLSLPHLSHISFENPDHSLVSVFVNINNEDQAIRIVFPGIAGDTKYQMLTTIPGNTIETIKWIRP